MLRRTVLTAALTLLPLLATALPASAQNWPDKPIKLLVPFAAGGNIDVNGRLMAARLSETLGQQMVVENRVGGSGIIATEAVARSAPDGYTLLWASTNVMSIVPTPPRRLTIR
jgi:tripartite-type tricarboxylate transporter receptor subunit TctC